MPTKLRLLALVATLVLAVACRTTTAPTTTRKPAPSMFGSNAGPDALPVDPSIEVVTLDNGLTCLLKQHQTPPGKVTMWLHISSGSLNEAESQRGLAHFLEHMAFNGTENFPPGELVKYFESIGMQFGRHQNAFTSFDQTTYTISLPNTKPATVAKGLTCLADYGFRMSLLPEEIDKERKVVLEEMRARDGVGRRISDKVIPLYAPGSRLAGRLPIGDEDIIRNATRELIKGYYDKWYRPDKAALVVVGDIDVNATLAQIKAEFGPWTRPPESVTGFGPEVKSYTTERAAIVTDPEQKEGRVSIVTITADQKEHTRTEFRRELVADLGFSMLNRRLNDLVRAGEAPFQQAGGGTGYLFNAGYMTSVGASGKPENTPKMIAILIEEIQRAKIHGFETAEHKQVVAGTISALEQAVKTEATRNARSIVSSLNRAVTDGCLPMSAAQRLELTQSLIHDITLAEIHQAFKANLPADRRLILATLPEDHTTGLTPQNLLAAVHAAERTEVARKEAEAGIDALLPTPPAPGKWAGKGAQDPDLEVLTRGLTNGITAHFRTMDYKKNQVFVHVTIAGGEILETKATRGLTQAAARVFSQPATSTYTSKQIRDFFVGKKVQVSGGVDEDRLLLSISGSPDDIEDGFQLAHLLLTKPQIENAAIDTWRNNLKLRFAAMRTVAEGRLFEEIPKLSTDDPRMHMITPEVLDGLQVEDAQKWLEHCLQEGYMEVAVVGDIPRDRALQLTATYFGSLPRRGDNRKLLDTKRRVKVKAGPIEKTIDVKSIANRAAVFVGWEVPGWEDRKAAQLLNLAVLVLQKQLREKIREQEGLTYSTAAFYRPSRAMRNTSVLGTFLTADPQKARLAMTLARRITEDLAANGPSAADLATAKKQLDTSLEQTLKEPGFWVGKLGELLYRDRDLEYYKNIRKSYAKWTAADVKAVLSKHIIDKNRVSVLATTGTAKAK